MGALGMGLECGTGGHFLSSSAVKPAMMGGHRSPTKQSMDSPTSNLVQMLRKRIDSLIAEDNIAEAIHAASAAIDKCQQVLGPDLDTVDAFVDVLEIRADLLRQTAEHEKAREDYRQAIDQLDDRPDRFMQLGRLHAGLGAAHDALGEPERAAVHWERAISFFERNDPPSPLDVAAMANNLGYLKKSAGDHDAAENAFLKALEILHEQHGPDHEETATVASNLGALYQMTGHPEPAREMHMIALEARRKLFGDTHPDTAQSHNNLALALSSTGDRSWARRHFEKALHAFEELGRDYHSDLEAVADNYCALLREDGEEVLAATIAGRVRDVVAAAAAVL